MTFTTPPDLRTTAQKFTTAHRIMERAIGEESFSVTAMYAEEVSDYMDTLERDMRYFIYHDEYVLNGIIDE